VVKNIEIIQGEKAPCSDFGVISGFLTAVEMIMLCKKGRLVSELGARIRRL
jgi:hypothetical protein